MITIKVKVEIGSVLRGLVDAERQLPYVMARALTLTGQDVKNAETRAISAAVQAPTPYTLRAVYLESATARRLQARVWLKNGNHRQHYLLSLIEGGGRPMKAFEKMLRGAGFMRPNERAVPGKAMQLDAYGNLSRAQINRIVSAITLQGPPAPKPVATKRKRASSVSSAGYFFSAGTASKRAVFGRYGAADQHLPRGIWERRVSGQAVSVRPVLLFVTHSNYSKALDFFGVADRVIPDRWPVHARSSVEALNLAWLKRGSR